MSLVGEHIGPPVSWGDPVWSPVRWLPLIGLLYYSKILVLLILRYWEWFPKPWLAFWEWLPKPWLAFWEWLPKPLGVALWEWLPSPWVFVALFSLQGTPVYPAPTARVSPLEPNFVPVAAYRPWQMPWWRADVPWWWLQWVWWQSIKAVVLLMLLCRHRQAANAMA
jgi:hypothetical protein